MKCDGGPMSDCLSRLVQMIIWSTPVEDPHTEQRQQGRIIDLPLVDHTKPFGPVDHMGPQPIVKEEVREDVIPPAMMGSCLVLPLLTLGARGQLPSRSMMST